MRLIDADALVGKCEFYETEMEVKNAPTVCDIEQIRAEIDVARFINKDTRLCKNANASGLEVALEIIDKYTKGASK